MISKSDLCMGSRVAMASESKSSISVDDAIIRLDAWLEERNWQGHDPYDLRAISFVRFLDKRTSTFGRRWASRIRRALFRHSELALKLLRQHPREIPKAMGLFMSSYSRLGKQLGDDKCCRVITRCADWLLENQSVGYPGNSWGYPFDWQSAVFIPKGTPSIVVSSTVGEGFLDAHAMTGRGEYLNIVRGVCEFIATGLNVTVDGDASCLSYTPLDYLCVHNANLMGAAFLMRASEELSCGQWRTTALKAAEYSLRMQNPDGSFYYESQESGKGRAHRDIYHSGFEIRALYQIWKVTGDSRYYQAVHRYLEFYQSAYIRSDGAPVRDEFNQPNASFDIHGCAEAILCPSTLIPDFPELAAQLHLVTEWTFSHMRNSDGSWAYCMDSQGRVDRTPYIRWGQAWMLRALAQAADIESRELGRKEKVELCGLV